MDEDRILALLENLSEAPDAQIDKTITPRIRAIINQPPQVQLKELQQIMNDCASASLASNFAMGIMQFVINEIRNQIKAEKEAANGS